MTEYVIFLIGLLCGLLISLLVGIIAMRTLVRRKIEEIELLKQIHREEFGELINKINHHGPIKEGATTVGLMNIILWAIERCLNSFVTLYENKDWNTKEPITELREIVMGELVLLHKKLSDFLESRRSTLREYDKHQGL